MLECTVEDATRHGLVVVLHGFTQSRWSLVDPILPIADQLGSTIRFLEAPGHGADRGPDDHHEFLAAVAAMEPTIVLGYSMGGRLALWLAATHPDLAAHVVAISANPGIPDEHERRRRREHDQALAARLEAIAVERGLGRPSDAVRAFLAEWDAQPLFRRRHLNEAALRARSLGTPSGWARSLRRYGTGEQPDLVPLLAASRARLSVLVGADDAAYRAHAARLRERAAIVVVPLAGHDVLAEQPAFAAGAILGLVADGARAAR